MRRFVLACLTASLAAAAPSLAQNAWDETSPSLKMIDYRPEGWLFEDELFAVLDAGEALFEAKFTILDGAGRPNATQAPLPNRPRSLLTNGFSRTSGPDASACSSCHNDPVTGGAGDFTTNVFTSSGFANAVFDSTDPELSNERGTNHLFGAGLLELLAREMTQDLHAIRDKALVEANAKSRPLEYKLETKGVSFGSLVALPGGLIDPSGIEGVDHDLVVKPFTQKGTIRSLRQFTVNALNHHSGMQADERFSVRWTGTDDFDEDGYTGEITDGQVSALVAWQATLAPPTQRDDLPEDWQAAATTGEALFKSFGCQSCHMTALPLNSLDFHDPGPFDGAGTLGAKDVERVAVYDLSLMDWAETLEKNEAGQFMVPLFGDLKRHLMTDADVNRLGNERVVQGFVDTNVFITAELWGIGSTAPYGHRNDITTLDEMILAHGGDARASRDQYEAASQDEQSAIIAFLKSLVIQHD